MAVWCGGVYNDGIHSVRMPLSRRKSKRLVLVVILIAVTGGRRGVGLWFVVVFDEGIVRLERERRPEFELRGKVWEMGRREKILLVVEVCGRGRVAMDEVETVQRGGRHIYICMRFYCKSLNH